MKKQLILIFLSACFISSCSTYKTNSKTTFSSTYLSGQEPVIHVGEITESPDKLTLLGWVEASVSKPSIIAKNPTEEQVDIILAEKGEALGADAIIYVTYKTRIGSLFLNKIEARGQAVKLKDNSAKLEGIKPKSTNQLPALPITKPVITNNAIDTIPPETIEASNNFTTEETPAESEPEISYADRNKEENIPTTVEEVLKIKSTSSAKLAPPVSLKTEVAQKDKEKKIQKLNELAEQAKRCEPTLDDIAEYESSYDALNYLIMNADYLLKKSRGLNDQDMESASLRLTQLLEQQLAKLKANKPVLKEQQP